MSSKKSLIQSTKYTRVHSHTHTQFITILDTKVIITLPHLWKYLFKIQKKTKHNSWSWSPSIRASNLHCKFTVSFKLEMESCSVWMYGNSQYSDSLLASRSSEPSVLTNTARMAHSWPFCRQQWAEQKALYNTVKFRETEQANFNGCIKHMFIAFPSWHMLHQIDCNCQATQL